MTMIGATATGDTAAFRSFNWTEVATTFADEWGPKLLESLRREAPVAPDGGGRLRDRLHFERRTSIGRLSMIFTDDVPYFPYVIEGTDGGTVIQPVAARALHWTATTTVPMLAGMGTDIFAAQVIRGSTPKNDFPTRVWASMRDVVQDAFREAVREGLGA